MHLAGITSLEMLQKDESKIVFIARVCHIEIVVRVLSSNFGKGLAKIGNKLLT